MIGYSRFKRGPDFVGWMRAPQAEKFTHQLREQEQLALEELLGACAMTTDPEVAGKLAAWRTVKDLGDFLQNTRKESIDDE